MNNIIPSHSILHELHQSIEKSLEDNKRINYFFNEKELSISEYKNSSLTKLLVSDFFTNLILVIVLSLVIGILGYFEWEIITIILLVLIFLGFLVMFFKQILMISIPLLILSFFGFFENYSYLGIIIIAYIGFCRFYTINHRKNMAKNFLENIKTVEDNELQIIDIIQEEMMPVAHKTTVATLDSIRDMTNTNFLNKKLVGYVLDYEYEQGYFQLIESMNQNGQKIYKSKLNNIPSSEHMETVELKI